MTLHGTGLSIVRLAVIALWVALMIFVLRVATGALYRAWTNSITAGMYSVLGGNPYGPGAPAQKAA